MPLIVVLMMQICHFVVNKFLHSKTQRYLQYWEQCITFKSVCPDYFEIKLRLGATFKKKQKKTYKSVLNWASVHIVQKLYYLFNCSLIIHTSKTSISDNLSLLLYVFNGKVCQIQAGPLACLFLLSVLLDEAKLRS